MTTAGSFRRRFTLTIVGWLIIGATCLVWVLRLTLRDTWPPLAPVFYAAQPVVLAAACAVVTGVALWQRRARQAAVASLLVVGSAAHWLTVSFRAAPPAPPRSDQTVRVLLWNITGQRFADTSLSRKILAHAPDIIVLVEAYTNQASQDAARAAGYAVEYSSRTPSLLLLARGEVTESEAGISGGGARILESRVRLGARSLRVLCVDIPSNPFVSRRAPLADVTARLQDTTPGEPTIIVGDFNTPPDSAFFEPIRALAACAWESAGRGYRCTWPTGLPVLAIDQIWATAGLTPTDCDMFTSLLSDHRMVVADLAWPANAP